MRAFPDGPAGLLGVVYVRVHEGHAAQRAGCTHLGEEDHVIGVLLVDLVRVVVRGCRPDIWGDVVGRLALLGDPLDLLGGAPAVVRERRDELDTQLPPPVGGAALGRRLHDGCGGCRGGNAGGRHR